MAVWNALASRFVVLIAVAFVIATYVNRWTSTRPVAAAPVVMASTNSYLVSEDDDAEEGEETCVPQKGALVGPVCVTIDGVGEDVLIT